MSNKKPFLVIIGLGLAILSFGEVTHAQENKSTLTTGISATGSISNTVTNINGGGVTRRGTRFQGEVIDGTTIPIPQDVFESINTSEADAVTGKSPEEIIVCLTDSCRPSNNFDGETITVNELANLIESDLNQALNDLVIAEKAASDGIVASDDSRQIVRKESDAQANCDCIPGEINIVRDSSKSDAYATRRNVMTVTEASQIVETKLEESSLFIEQVNQLKPENSLW